MMTLMPRHNSCFNTLKDFISALIKPWFWPWGGGSWKKLGSDGAWTDILTKHHIPIAPLRPTNCGFFVHWSEHFKQRFAGLPLKAISLTFDDQNGFRATKRGELILTEQGVEGSLIYAFSAPLRDTIERSGQACFQLDLCPDYTLETLAQQLAQKPKHKTLSAFLKNKFHLDAAKLALIFEYLVQTSRPETGTVAHLLKHYPITVYATTPLDEAISSAGGVCLSALNEDLMLKTMTGVFCAGEMLDWEAPTGGYLLTGCLTTGQRAGEGVVRWLRKVTL